jgi:hypothetical protein
VAAGMVVEVVEVVEVGVVREVEVALGVGLGVA